MNASPGSSFPTMPNHILILVSCYETLVSQSCWLKFEQEVVMGTYRFTTIDKDSNVPFLDVTQWSNFHDKVPIKTERSSILANSIVRRKNTKEPRSPRTEEQCRDKMLSLHGTNTVVDRGVTKDRIMMKHTDYQFNIGRNRGVIPIGHSHNIISDFFQRDNRIQCGGYNRISPYQLWTGNGLTTAEHRDHLQRSLGGLWRMNNKNRLGVAQYQECARLSATVYTAAQFKPRAAKTVYDLFGAKDVIDFSMGWGDRLAGWYSTQRDGIYIGTDPNEAVYNTYQEQIASYQEWIDSDKKTIILNEAAEDVDWSSLPKVDLVFTSPPYFDTEMYAKGSSGEENQSWYRYQNGEQWLNEFLYPVLQKTSARLRKGGHLAINIIDVEQNGLPRVRICDAMHNFCTRHLKMRYSGYIGMRMKQRPKAWTNMTSKNEFMSKVYVEPIWVWKKV